MSSVNRPTKTLQTKRYIVHLYLDGIWLFSTSRRKARNAMYNWLATQMNITPEEAHVSKFNSTRCDEAIRILKPKYIQIYGRDIVKEDKMFYAEYNLVIPVSYKRSSQDDNLYNSRFNINIYCKSRVLNENNVVEDYSTINNIISEKLAYKYLNSLPEFAELYPTKENIAKWICEQIVTCYKVQIDDGIDSIIYEEEES